VWLRKRLRLPVPGVSAADRSSAEFVRYLESLLPDSVAPIDVQARLARFRILSADRQDQDLPGLYLLLEQEIAGAGGKPQKVRAELHRAVAKHFASLLARPGFALIFAPPDLQQLLLCKTLLLGTLGHAFSLLGGAGNDVLRSLSDWLKAVPDAPLPVPFDLMPALPSRNSEWVALFFRLSRELHLYLEERLGESCARSFYERSYGSVADQYAALETFPVVVNLLPEKLLDSDKIGKLNRNQIQKVLLRKLDELNDINAQQRRQYDELDFARRELVKARDELELRVAERTAELSATNEQLRQEVAERRRAEERLRAAKDEADLANRAKSEFLANMSHELRTPLNAIIGFSEIMRDGRFGALGNPQYLAYIRDIHESGEHLLGIINQVLDMAKIEAGKVELRESPVDVPGAIRAIVRLIAPRAADSGVEIGVAAPTDLPALHADDRLVRQMLLNLLSNAVKFTPAGGTVTVEATVETSGGLAVRIVDTGIGMAPQDIRNVLKPFGQVEGALSRKHGGTGLGLPLAKSFAELHGGTLALESALGAGTTATVRFPKERVQAPGARRANN
jgi:signal transduction histidine kinase